MNNSRGTDFQSADSVGDIAIGIWDMVFPSSEQDTKTSNFLLNIKILLKNIIPY